MTTHEFYLLNKLMDINSEMRNEVYPRVVLEALNYRYRQVEDELIDEMGYEEYYNFKKMGAKMFATKED